MRHLLFAVILIAVAACTPVRQLYDAAADKSPRFDTGVFYQSDEAALPYRVWKPKSKLYQKNPKAVIVALHGFNDYSSAFESAGPYFSKQGFVMYAYDQRGFGSAPQAGIWPGQDNLVHDLANFVRLVKVTHPDSPVYILGESMGGAVAIVALSSPEFPKIDGGILVAPAIWGEDTMNIMYRATLWMAAHMMPSYRMTGSDLKILASNNIPMLQRMARDPLVIKSTRVDAIYGIVKLMDSAYHHVPNVNVPLLLLYGSEDQVIPHEPIKRALGRFKHPVRYVYYPGSYHMLLRDIQGEAIQADIASWIQHPDAPMPSGHSDVEVEYVPTQTIEEMIGQHHQH
jgi:acylglycerol lipase